MNHYQAAVEIDRSLKLNLSNRQFEVLAGKLKGVIDLRELVGKLCCQGRVHVMNFLGEP